MNLLLTSRYDSNNSYLKEIVDELMQYSKVICSIDAFWHSNFDFDIIHIQWPEELFNWKMISENSIQKLKLRILYWKSKGVKVVATRHNEIPHRSYLYDKILYETVYNNCDAVVHLAEYSKTKLATKTALNLVISHPLYHSVYKELNIKTAKEKLGIPKNAILFLSFGAIRYDFEENQIIEAFKSAKLGKNHFLIICNSLLLKKKPRFNHNPIKHVYYELKIRRLNAINIVLKNKISSEDLSNFISASDIVISPRVNTLNSGVVYMAYTFNKTVIGPSIGNIKEILEAQNYPVFEPLVIKSIISSMKEALRIKGNKELKKHIDNKQIAQQHYSLYTFLCSKKI